MKINALGKNKVGNVLYIDLKFIFEKRTLLLHLQISLFCFSNYTSESTPDTIKHTRVHSYFMFEFLSTIPLTEYYQKSGIPWAKNPVPTRGYSWWWWPRPRWWWSRWGSSFQVDPWGQISGSVSGSRRCRGRLGSRKTKPEFRCCSNRRSLEDWNERLKLWKVLGQQQLQGFPTWWDIQ